VYFTTTFAPEDTHGVSSGERVFQEVTWTLRSELLKGSRQKKNNEFFETYRACFLTHRNAQEWPMLKELLELSLSELTEWDIFPPRVFLAQSSAPRLGSILTLINHLEAGALGNPTLAGNSCPAH
jgi:hypothetical protein